MSDWSKADFQRHSFIRWQATPSWCLFWSACLSSYIAADAARKEDDKVRLNVKRIKAGKDYEKMNPKYKEFVESNEGTIFTAHVERQTLTSLKEQPEWLFWNGNLIAVETAETKEQE